MICCFYSRYLPG